MSKQPIPNPNHIRSNSPIPTGKLLAIGGKEDKGNNTQLKENTNHPDFDILGRFVKELKGDKPLIALIPTASSVPDEVAEDYREAFKKLHSTNIEVIDVRSRADSENPAYHEMINQAAGIFFTGGDQLKLTAMLGGTVLLERIKERYYFDDIIIAGTSAGAAAMSTQMIYEGDTSGGMLKGDVKITAGLGFLDNVAIDTHFITRGRIVRMAQMIATNPGYIGIGLEEDTALLITGGSEVEVLGSGLVTIVDGRGITDTNIYEIDNGIPFSVQGLRLHFIAKGERYQIPV